MRERVWRLVRRYGPFAIGGVVLIVVGEFLRLADAPSPAVVAVEGAGWVVVGATLIVLAVSLLRGFSRERCLAVAAGALGLFVISVLLHNVIYGLFEVEEAFFFILATIVSPLLFIAALIGVAIPRAGRTHDEGTHGPWALPAGLAGKLSMGLLVASGVGFLLFFGGVASGQRGGDTFFSNPYLAVTILFAGACVVLAGAVALVAIVKEGERTVGAFATVIFGVFAAIFAAGEIGGHDEPGSDSPDSGGTNSHSNLAVTPVSETEVHVEFDYGYHGDPAEAEITMLTITALGPTGGPLPGPPSATLPESGDLQKGDGHVDLVLGFSRDVLAQVTGFRVCFAAPGYPDLGCATASYSQ